MKTRVMIIEDNEFIRLTMKDFLSKRGYDIVMQPGPADGPLTTSEAPHDAGTDILISGLSTPNMTGLQTIGSQIRKNRKKQNVALMSAAWAPEEVAYAKKIGCKVLAKPLRFDELGRWLNECESKNRPHRGLFG
jgi:two-component system, chemotaxis family, chemotaxis protein CheY